MHLPKPNEGGSFTPPPAGTFPAICYRVIDLGTQDTTFKGEPSRKHKIMISWELHDDDAKTEDGHPMSISHFYTWSMHEKSTLRKYLEAWRGKRFEDKDFGEGGFNIKKLLGQPCLVSVVHSDDGAYANVSSISKLPKGMTVGSAVNPLTYLWIAKGVFNEDVFAGLSEKMQLKIKASPEYQELVNGKAEYVTKNDNDLDDEIPF